MEHWFKALLYTALAFGIGAVCYFLLFLLTYKIMDPLPAFSLYQQILGAFFGAGFVGGLIFLYKDE